MRLGEVDVRHNAFACNHDALKRGCGERIQQRSTNAFFVNIRKGINTPSSNNIRRKNSANEQRNSMRILISCGTKTKPIRQL